METFDCLNYRIGRNLNTSLSEGVLVSLLFPPLFPTSNPLVVHLYYSADTIILLLKARMVSPIISELWGLKQSIWLSSKHGRKQYILFLMASRVRVQQCYLGWVASATILPWAAFPRPGNREKKGKRSETPPSMCKRIANKQYLSMYEFLFVSSSRRKERIHKKRSATPSKNKFVTIGV